MVKNPEQNSFAPHQEAPEDNRDTLPTAHESMGEAGDPAADVEEIDKNIEEMVAAMKEARIDLQRLDPDGRLIKALNSGKMDRNSSEALDLRAQLLILQEGAEIIGSQLERKFELTGR